MIQSLLIANRGEIACRIIRTARAMGVRTIAVYSDADAKALHVRQADEAVHIGPSPARESYLVGEKIIAAAKATGAEAIHPGYGFLSENADFAQAVIDAGIVWVGPNPDSIRAMGLKDAAKERMIAAGVPVTPGYLGADQSPERLAAEAAAVGYPVLIKAVAGGGGKGMRRVDDPADFADALVSCQREAASSFGNTDVLIEKYILSPRHIEVQVFGDTHGTVVHLFERDCSLQRRHQKVIEEAPAPGMDAATREAICAAAVKAAKAVDYVGAGTIEFIADASEGLRADHIWFMEMNTRLQVEHPVTEEITGVDLVEWQLRVASGEALPKRQDELSINGWAMEARLYAENPATGFLPSTGRLDHLSLPDGERIETGVAERDVISPYYDPMIAKIVSWGETRDAARRDLAVACAAVECEPVRTNAWFLSRLLDQAEFAAGNVTTGFIADRIDTLCEAPRPSDALLQYAGDDVAFDSAVFPVRWDSPIFELTKARFGFRLNAKPQRQVRLNVDGAMTTVDVQDRAIWYDHARTVIQNGSARTYFENGAAFVIAPERASGSAASAAADGAILSPMPGRIIAVDVAAGDSVTKGQKLVTLEAMKMEHSLVAPFDGTVAELNVEIGGQTQEGIVLARLARADAA
ncbi:acetyl/propionyl/methylcrotonyl-CoA carboxylase subunit alpha [Sphingomonas sp. 10B4]|uniref:acetyl/propionyl/methylcrotonyl-CoA carboxylase subunit alpha n=1 Tax=Sphingomonas sp. 10B4 TaxID=3048575 RepID=UPI002AB57977|nr:biotin carboxylase N-terminal domain-containing protein [Sphingomonas sp. 10B4]MDY7522719.1 biotin carboxylase N-terminal domain-containing protein [Sphingomonas sp. 10B4]MEB0283692.1 biotin carboxylase N-terminal domain-containing protein [Sphingomonas sp. 10B4]